MVATKSNVSQLRKTERTSLSGSQLQELYGAMMLIRTLDERMMTLQRQGRIGFYGACTGQEAACLASAFALRPSDWIFPALREGAAMLLRGYPLAPYISQVFGNSGDPTKGRQMPSHHASKTVNQVSWGSCIGTQLPQAVGAAWAAKLKKEDTVVLAYLGDGATSSADFHTAMNFAGVFKAPVVFVCQNNHWSISVPTTSQTASESIAIKASAYGFAGVKVDGNDIESVYGATREAVDKARSGGGPTLIEAETYRMGAHSSSDDPTRYRDQKEVDEWKARDPLDRLRCQLEKAKLWDDAQEGALKTKLLGQVNEAIAQAEALPAPSPETVFDDLYAEEPWNIREQRAEMLDYLSRRKP
ncbi:MAG: thiamine pyrophosphate-dependent dehydrogenase E1 component subunit alpha [Myxococcaceae bacterium]